MTWVVYSILPFINNSSIWYCLAFRQSLWYEIRVGRLIPRFIAIKKELLFSPLLSRCANWIRNSWLRNPFISLVRSAMISIDSLSFVPRKRGERSRSSAEMNEGSWLSSYQWIKINRETFYHKKGGSTNELQWWGNDECSCKGSEQMRTVNEELASVQPLVILSGFPNVR